MVNLQEDNDLENTVKISARRFEESPFISRVDDKNMVRGVYAGRFHAIYNGEDVLEKYWVLRTKALIYDVPEKPIQISGPDAEAFLQKIFSRDISKLIEGKGLYSLACTPNGGVFMDGILFKLASEKYWYVQADGDFETWLLAHSEDFNVEIHDPNSRVIQIQGPNSLDIMQTITKGNIDESMKYYSSGFFEINNHKVYISRTGFTGELGFEIYTLESEKKHCDLWDYIMDHGKSFGLEFSSCRSITIRRIEAGILGNLTDMDRTMTPFEAGLGKFVNLDKSNFVGKKALMNVDKKPLLMGFTCSEAIPSAGSLIMENNKPVGMITSGVDSPTLKCGVGYVRFTKPADWVGKKLTIKLKDGSESIGKVVELPFFDIDKKLVKGK